MYECSKSNGNIVVMTKKNPVILDLIEFEIFTWRLLKIALPGFRFQHFLGEQLAPRNPQRLAPLALAVFPAVKKYSYQYEHPLSNPSYAPGCLLATTTRLHFVFPFLFKSNNLS